MGLTKYDEARNALALCASIDEVKDIQDKSEAMRLYAKMSENTELEIFAATIKLRAQVRLGQIISAMATAQGQHRSTTGTKSKEENIKAAGLSKTTAHSYEKLADVPEEVIEKFIAESTEAKKPVSLPKAIAFAVPPKPTISHPPKEKPIVEPTPRPEMITIEKEVFEEMQQLVKDSLKDSLAMEDVIDSDDQLGTAMKKILQLTAELELASTRFNGIQNELNECKKAVKSRDRQILALKREIAGLKAEPF